MIFKPSASDAIIALLRGAGALLARPIIRTVG